MTRQKALLGALVLLVVSLIFGSVYTTGAYWADDAPVSGSEITTGTIGLSAGSQSGSGYTFPLGGQNIVVNSVNQANLVITNTGTTPINFALKTAGPSVSNGPGVTIDLAGGVGVCPVLATDPLPPTSAFTATGLTGPSSPTAAATRPLASGASETWCIRAKLTAASGTGSSTYTIPFTFDVQQKRP
ncbi:hypothetical protein [Gordonia phthalatica]|uniref:SipW-cognate class signal peptide n=1 Tax=Gordonia phthalatica TaxID=1136941 RepID=A0A0N9N1S0_9ACTN|nr:hypothetical protein [Gordonia phthalatica]ALG84085.1 hypothetical protein ACH46_05655 [Gordonia phthalatica]